MGSETELPIYIRVAGVEQAKEAIKSVTEGISGGATGGGGGEHPGTKPVKELGEAAEGSAKSFEVLQSGIEGVGQIIMTGSLASGITALKGFGSSVEEAGAKSSGLGGVLASLGGGFAAAAAVVGTLAVGVHEFAEKMTESVLGFTELAEAAGMSKEEFAALEEHFAKVGIGAEQMAQTVRIVANHIQTEWGNITKAVRDSADEQEKDVLRISAATRGLAEAHMKADAAPRAVRAAERGVTSAQDAVAEAERSEISDKLALEKAKISYADKFEGGRGVTGLDRQHLKNLEEDEARANIERLKEKVDQAPQHQQEAIDKQAAASDALTKAKMDEQAAVDGVTKASIALTEAQNQQKDNLMKDPGHLAAAIKAGGGGVDFSQVKPQDLMKSFILSGAKDGKPSERGTIEAAEQFAKIIPEDQSNILEALAPQFGFRRTGGPKFVEALRKGNLFLEDDQSKAVAKQMDDAAPSAKAYEESEALKNIATRGATIKMGVAEAKTAIEENKGIGTLVDALATGAVKAGGALDSLKTAADSLGTSLRKLLSGGAAPASAAERAGSNSATSKAEAIQGGGGTAVEDTGGGEGGGFASGGVISGPGGPTDDQVPIWASHGEFVVTAAGVSRVGAENLHAINRGDASIVSHAGGARFASGGMVNAGAMSGGVGSVHVLDLRTDGGDFRTTADKNVLASIGQSAIAGRMTSQGSPSWRG